MKRRVSAPFDKKIACALGSIQNFLPIMRSVAKNLSHRGQLLAKHRIQHDNEILINNLNTQNVQKFPR